MTSALISLFGVFTSTFLPLAAAAPTAPPTHYQTLPPLDFQYQAHVLGLLHYARINTAFAQIAGQTAQLTVTVYNRDVAGPAIPVGGARVEVVDEATGAVVASGVTSRVIQGIGITAGGSVRIAVPLGRYRVRAIYGSYPVSYYQNSFSNENGRSYSLSVILGNELEPSSSPSVSPTPSPSTAPGESPSPTPALPDEPDEEDPLHLYISTNQLCTEQGTQISYRLIARNFDRDEALERITLQFKYPEGTNFLFSDPHPDEELTADHIIEYYIPLLAPGDFAAYSVIINVDDDIKSVATNLTGFYFRQRDEESANPRIVLTDHVINGTCAPGDILTTALPSAEPAIVCDPSERGCQSTYRSLALGRNYQNAQPYTPELASRLGPRFQEAIADIVPGECSVLADNLIASPAYQDALNRRAKPVTVHLQPIGESSADFRQLALENEILGSQNLDTTYAVLRRVHQDNWQEFVDLLAEVLKTITPTTTQVPTGNITSRYDQFIQTWLARIRAEQPALSSKYQEMQIMRQDKFPPLPDRLAESGLCTTGNASANEAIGPEDSIGIRAIKHAYQATRAVCARGGAGTLCQTMPGAQARYKALLDERERAYDRPPAPANSTQQQSIDAYAAWLPPWRAQLETTLEQFNRDAAAQVNDPDTGHNKAAKERLSGFRLRVITASQQGEAVLRQAYHEHDRQDEVTLNTFRLQQWEAALDSPKSVATTCEAQNTFNPKIETTWCESGSAAEGIIQEAPVPAKNLSPTPGVRIHALVPINGGEETEIDGRQTRGQVCGGGPGDPFWTVNCSCNCNDPSCPRNLITRHDIYLTTRLECLQEIRHDDPYF